MSGLIALICAAAVTGCVQAFSTGVDEGKLLKSSNKRLIRKGEIQLHDLAFIPPDGIKILQTGGDGAELVLQSEDGYFITFNSSVVAPVGDLENLAEGLESIFLKEGGKWRQKLAFRKFPLAGSPALDILYQGPHTKDRVIYWRTPQRDFAIMFFAPTTQFDLLTQRFDAMLDSFETISDTATPGFDTAPPGASSVKKDEELEAASPAPTKSTKQQIEREKPALLMGEVVDERLGFRVRLPKNWVSEIPEANATRWGGGKRDADFLATFDLRNVRMPGLGRSNRNEAVNFILKQLRDQIFGYAKDANFEWGKQPSHEAVSGVDGLSVRLKFGGQWYIQKLAVVSRENDDVFHVVTVTVPEALPSHSSLGETVLASFQPID